MHNRTWSRWVSRLFNRQGQPLQQQRRPRLRLEFLEERVIPATNVWTGAGGTGLWGTAANWSLARAPISGDDLVFAVSPSTSTTNNLSGLSLNSITISASNYTLSGNQVTIGANLITGTGVTNEKISLDLAITAASSFTVNTGSDLTVSGHISGPSAATLSKRGTGLLTLTNDNSLVLFGAIDVQAGILAITNSKALGATSAPTTVEANAQLQVGGGGLAVAETLIVNGPGINADGALLNTVGSNSWTGSVIMDSDAAFGANANTVLTISGQISDTGFTGGHNLTKVGTGQIIFSRVGGNTYRGQTIINNGILTIQDPLSLGAGADSTKPQSGTLLSSTIVNFNPATGDAGTLQLSYVSLAANDPNAVLLDPTKAFNSVTNPIVGFQVFNDLITLNGPGFGGIGALSNLAGNNGWDGNVFLGGGSPNTGAASIGAAASTVNSPNTDLTISGVVSDPNQTAGSPGALTKVLGGRVILNNNNTYRGSTTVAAGTLSISDSHALGNNASDTTPGTGTTVVSGATLELQVDSGLDGTAARTHGRNLGFDSATKSGPAQEIVVTSSAGAYSLTFNGSSTPFLAYNATAAQVQSALNSLSSIGGVGGSVSVTQTGTVYRVVFGGTLAGVNVPLMTASVVSGANVVINPVYGLQVAEALTINGSGVNGVGALHSVSGINVYTAGIALGSLTAAIGVDNDARAGHPLANSTYFTNDHSLTVTGVISGGQTTTFAKVDPGQLILSGANTYLGRTNVVQGWITAENNLALGSAIPNIADTLQSSVTVQAGAAIHLKSLTPGANLAIGKNFVLYGQGITHPFSLINQEGALLNLSGANSISGSVALNQNVGIGVQNLDPNPTVNPSQLTLTGPTTDFLQTSRTFSTSASGGFFANSNIVETGSTTGGTIVVNYDMRPITDRLQIFSGPRGTPGSTLIFDSGFVSGVGSVLVPYGPSTSTQLEIVVNPNNGNNGNTTWSYTATIKTNPTGQSGGITKLGTGRLILQGPGSYTAGVDVKEGTLRADSDSALGQFTSGAFTGVQSNTSTTTTVEAGALLEFGNSIPINDGGLQSAPGVNSENLILNGTAQQLSISGVSGTFTLSFGTGANTTTAPLDINSPTLAAQIQTALNSLSSIGGVGGSVTVTKVGGIYRVVFGGTLIATNNALLVATPTANSDARVLVNGSTASVSAVAGDTFWRGNVTLAANTWINVGPNARLTLNGAIDDGTNTSSTGSNLTKLGNGELVLQGANTYRGTTFVSQGIVAVANSQGLGSPVGGTVVSLAAQLQLRGNLSIAGESLTLQGTGPGAGSVPSSIPVHWVSVGPGPINGAQTAGNQASTGRVTGVAVDPADDNVIYISTAGGGAWKTIDGGLTWTQLFDGVSAIQKVTVTGTAGTFTLTFGNGAGTTTAPLPFNATAEQVEDALDALTSVSGVGGSVSVSLSGNVYTITFNGGSLASKAQPLISAIGSGGTTTAVVNVPNGVGSGFATFSGAIVIAPSDHRILYLGTGEANNSGDSYYGTGVYKSTDSGRTWSLVVDNSATPNPLYGQAVSKMVVDPTNPNLFYVATSDLAANAPTLLAPAGIWRYDGTKWSNLTAVVSNARTVANTGPGTPGPDDDFRYVFPQTDVDWSDLTLSGPPGNQVLFAALGVPDAGSFRYPADYSNAVYRNLNPQSATPIWFVGTPGTAGSGEFPAGPFGNAPHPPPTNGLIRIAANTIPVYNGIDNIDHYLTTIYATVATPDDPFVYGNYAGFMTLYKTTVDSRTPNIINWAAVGTNLPNYLQHQGTYDNFIVVSATNPNLLYVGGVVDNLAPAFFNNQILVSQDGGATWTDISIDAKGNGPHTDEHAAVIDAEGRLVVGNDGGVWRYEPNPASPSFGWTDLNGNLVITQLNGIAQNPTNPNIVLGGSQDNGASITTDGQTWKLTDGGDGGEINFDPLNPMIAYHVQNGALRKSTDGGNTWATVLTVSTNILYFPFEVDPVNSARVLVGGGNGGPGSYLQESLNQGTTWRNIGGNLPGGFDVTAVAAASYQGNLPNGTFQFDPSFPLVTDHGSSSYDPDTIYVTDGFSIEVTKNHGQNWARRNIPGFNGTIEGITVDPRNRDTLYVVASDPAGSGNGRVYVTTDAGRTWTNITGNLPDLPTWKLVIDPRSGSLYVGSDNGVWTLPNGVGLSWERFGAGMPNVQVIDLELNMGLNLLTAGTYGRGAFQLYLDNSQADSGALNVVSGTSIWTGTVTFTGATTISVGGSQALPNGAAAAQLNILGQIKDATAGANYAFSKDGQGTLILSAANTYGGVTEVVGGVLEVNNPLALGASRSGANIVAQGGTIVDAGASLELESDLQGESIQLNGDGVAPGLNGHNTGALRNISGNNTYTGTLTLNTASTIGVDSGSQLTIGSSPNLTGTGTIVGLNDLTKELTGTLILSSSNSTYGGATTVNQGVLRVQNSAALGTGALGVKVLDGAQIQIQSSANGTPTIVNVPLTLSGTGIFGSGALLNSGGNNAWNGPITFTALPGFSPFTFPNGMVAINTPNAADTLTIGGPISESSPTGLRKLGPGKLVLQKPSTYSGSTSIDQGIIEIQDGAALGVRNTTAAIQQILTLSDQQTGTFTLTFNGQSVTLGWGAAAASVQTALNNLSTIGGVGGSVTVTSTAVQTTTQTGPGAPNTGYVYTVTFGGTLLNTTNELSVVGSNGTFASESVVAIGGIGVLVNPGTELDLSGSANFTTTTGLELNLNGSGFSGQGPLRNLSGNNTWAGSIDFSAPTTINVLANSSLTSSGGINGGSNALTKTGTGTLALAAGATDTYGNTIISAGSVQADAVIGNVLLSGGTISGKGTVGTITQGSGSGGINPGDNYPVGGIGTLTSGAVTLNSADQVFVDLGAAGVNDLLNAVGGNINLNGASLAGQVGSGGSVGDQYVILQTDNAHTINGQFASGSTATIGGVKFSVSYTAHQVILTRAGISLSVVSSQNPSVYGQSVTFTVTISTAGGGQTPTGTVTFILDGTTTLGSRSLSPVPGGASASFSVATIPAGNHTITAVYSGDANYSGTAGSTPQTVMKDTTTVGVTSSVNPSATGQAVTFTATISPDAPGSGAATGTVTFMDGATVLGTGTVSTSGGVSRATFTTSTLSAGDHVIQVVYNGDSNFVGSTSDPITQSVIVSTTQPTTTSLTSSGSPTIKGQSVTFTASVSAPGAATGTVSFFDGANLLGTSNLTSTAGGGTATFSTSGLSLGSHNITAVYSGNSSFSGSTSGTVVQVVNKASTSSTVTASTTTANTPVTFTATVFPIAPGTGVPTGNVMIYLDGVLRTSTTLVNGKASFSSFGVASGTHTVTVVYAGDANYFGSTTSTNFTFSTGGRGV
jgi:autotransporter-associated beta strand protein